MIHEELFDARGNCRERAGTSRLILHHFNQFKPTTDNAAKHRLYSYLLLRAATMPGYRSGTNAYWYTDYLRAHFEVLLAAANEFAADMKFRVSIRANSRRRTVMVKRNRGRPGAHWQGCVISSDTGGGGSRFGIRLRAECNALGKPTGAM